MNIDFAHKSLGSAWSLFMCTNGFELHYVTAQTSLLYNFTLMTKFIVYIKKLLNIKTGCMPIIHNLCYRLYELIVNI